MCLYIFRHISKAYYLMHTPYKDQTLNINMQLKLLAKEASCRKISLDVKENNTPKIGFKNSN